MRSRLQHGYCIGVSRRNARATAGKGLAQGPYVAGRAGVEPTTLRLKVIASTKAPPRPTRSRINQRSRTEEEKRRKSKAKGVKANPKVWHKCQARCVGFCLDLDEDD